jgi:hypothetical protein
MPVSGFMSVKTVTRCYAQRLGIVAYFVLMAQLPVRLYSRVYQIVVDIQAFKWQLPS